MVNSRSHFVIWSAFAILFLCVLQTTSQRFHSVSVVKRQGPQQGGNQDPEDQNDADLELEIDGDPDFNDEDGERDQGDRDPEAADNDREIDSLLGQIHDSALDVSVKENPAQFYFYFLIFNF